MLTMHKGEYVKFGDSVAGNFKFFRAPLFKDGYPNMPDDAPPGTGEL